MEDKIDYTIGQEIICIDTKNKFGNPIIGVVENKVYIVLGLRLSPCCNKPEVDIGNDYTKECNVDICGYCGKEMPMDNYYRATRFKKLDTLVNINELTEVLETTKPFEV